MLVFHVDVVIVLGDRVMPGGGHDRLLRNPGARPARNARMAEVVKP